MIIQVYIKNAFFQLPLRFALWNELKEKTKKQKTKTKQNNSKLTKKQNTLLYICILISCEAPNPLHLKSNLVALLNSAVSNELTGATQLILIPFAIHSTAKLLVKFCTPARAAPVCLHWKNNKCYKTAKQTTTKVQNQLHVQSNANWTMD